MTVRASNRDTHRPPRARSPRREARLAATAVLLSGSAAVLAVRLSSPGAVDEALTALVAFFALPGVLIFSVALAARRPGLFVAAFLPFAWTALVWQPTDGLAIWLVPVAAVCAIVLAARLAGRTRPRRVVTWGGVALAAAVVFAPGPSQPREGARVVLIGIDGACWQRIDPLMDAGRMPHFARLVARGRRADLRSLPSAYSPQVWSTIATGCTPDVHGILGFAESQADFRVGRIWDQVAAEKRSYGVCGWYFTWPPPDDLDPRSFVVPSTLAPDGQTAPPGYSFIKEMWAAEHGLGVPRAARLRSGVQAFRGGVALSTLRRAAVHLAARPIRRLTPRDKAWRARQLGVAFQTDVFVTLLRSRRPEFGALLLNQVDQVSHRYWKYSRPEGFTQVTPEQQERYGRAVDELYIEVDRSLGKILRAVPPDCGVVVVSDHGFQASTGNLVGRTCRIRTENLIALMGLSDALTGANVDRVAYLQEIGTSGAGTSEPLGEAERLLRGARLRGDDRPLFDVEHEWGLVRLSMVQRDAVPDGARVVLGDRDYAFEELFITKPETFFSGMHAPDGVYVLAGPSVELALEADSLNVLDVAPTVAALLDLPASPEWQGRPALRPGAYRFPRVARYPLPASSSEDVVPIDESFKERLRAFGYLE